LGGALCGSEQLPDALDVVRSNRAGEQAVMADAMSAHQRAKSLILLDVAGGKNIIPRFRTTIRRARMIC
jgi:hypothetical protein